MGMPMIAFSYIGSTIKVQVADRLIDAASFVNPRVYCEDVRTASGAGFYVFPSHDFDINYDGNQAFVNVWDGEKSEASQLLSSPMNLPGVSERWDAQFPSLKSMCYPNIAPLCEKGHFHIWSGLYFTHDPGLKCWIRYPANFARMPDISFCENVVDASERPRPLFINFRFMTSGAAASFKTDRPFIQIIPMILGKPKRPEEFFITASALRRTFHKLEDINPTDVHVTSQKKLNHV
jgi:hypothetical protein